MPKDVVQRLNREIADILKQKDVIDRLLGGGTVPTPSTPEEFTTLIRDEIKKWGEVVKAAEHWYVPAGSLSHHGPLFTAVDRLAKARAQ